MIALPAQSGGGPFRYFQMLLKKIAEYELIDVSFIIYKQKQISIEYLGVPSSLNVEYVDVPNLGFGIRRILFEQTLFYLYLKPLDVLYSYCTSMPLLARCKKVFTLHDVYYLTTKERYGFLQRTYLTWMTKLYCKLCDTVLTVSEFSYNEIRKYLKVPEDRLFITYNFIDNNTSVH